MDFEIFPFGKVYQSNKTITEDLTPIGISCYNVANPGNLEITAGNFAKHIGSEARLRNALATFRFLCASEVQIHFYRPEAGVRLGVNGSFVNSTGFSTFNGQTVGGANVTVADGKITISGDHITSVTIGGKDTIIDHICHADCIDPPHCVDFETLPSNEVYLVDPTDFFAANNILFVTQPYELPNGNFIDNGSVSVSSENRAGHFGKELRLSDATLIVAPPNSCMQDVSFRYGQYASRINIQINGSNPIVTTNFTDLNGMTIGGVLVTVTSLPATGGVQGFVQFEGIITNMKIGGRDLYIDHFCYDVCPPLSIVDITFVSNEPVNATQREITVDVEFEGPAVLRIQESSDIGVNDQWSNLSTTVTTPNAGLPEIKRCVARVPLSTDRLFFRIRATYN